MSYRCCTHCSCAEDGDDQDRHGQSCGGEWAICSTGGDEWVDNGDVYDFE